MGGRVSNLPEQTKLEMVENLQKQMSDIDHSVTGLAKSIDSMQAVSQMLLLHLEKKPESQNDTCQDVGNTSKDQIQTVSDTASQLLLSIEESVTDHKYIALQNVGKLLKSLVNGLVENDLSGNESLEKEKFAIHRYLAAKSPVQAINSGSYYDEKIQSLHFEIGKLKTIVKSQCHQIDILNEKESGLINEKNILQQQLKQMETNGFAKYEMISQNDDPNPHEKYSEKAKHNSKPEEGFNDLLKDLSEGKAKELVAVKRDLELETKKHIDDVEKLEAEKTELEGRYKALLEKLESMQNKTGLASNVQLFRPWGRNLVDGAFIETLKSKAEHSATKLVLTRCNREDQIKPDNCVLILCECKKGEYVTDLFSDLTKEITVSNSIGIVIFHMKNEKNIPQSSKYMRQYSSRPSFGGIFDIACDIYKNMLTCERNEDTFNEILNFINQIGVFKSKSTLHR